MLKLGGKAIEVSARNLEGSKNVLLSITKNADLPRVLRSNKAYIVQNEKIPYDFNHYFIFEKHLNLTTHLPKNANYTILSHEFLYLGEGDIVRLLPDRGSIRVLFRADSRHNSILVTEQCNHFCLMCSQPPKNIDDSFILDEIEDLIPLIPKETTEIGFTGGEPTTHGDRFIHLLELTRNYLPNTSIHILSNGRRFSNISYSKKYAAVDHTDMMVGIPVYSDDPSQHDYIVQAKGAFDETIRGILNLKRLNQKVELRIVIHKQNVDRLVNLANFITRNLLFVDQVVLMGLEMMGFARINLDKLWIDPYEYKEKLSAAVSMLSLAGVPVSVYNHPLCLVNDDVIPFYKKSISDWKNEFLEVCDSCTKKHDCGGFFSSGIKYKYSPKINPFK